MTSGPFSIGIGQREWPGLAKLIEEAGEVVQVAAKIIALHRPGWKNGDGENLDHWDGTNLYVRLTEELADLQAAIDFVVHYNPVDDVVLETRTAAKTGLYERWHRG